MVEYAADMHEVCTALHDASHAGNKVAEAAYKNFVSDRASMFSIMAKMSGNGRDEVIKDVMAAYNARKNQ